MSAHAFNGPNWWQRLRPWFSGFDLPLLLAIAWLMGLGLVCMYSAGYDHGTRFVDHGRNTLLAIAIIFIIAQVPPQRMMALAVPLYAVGVTLLVATALFGITKKGATRWLNVGVTQIQPSEILKIAVPLMLAWWFQKREGQLRLPDFVAAFILLAVPVGLVAKQPDLGTSILVLSAGLYVIFFAGLSWRLIIPAFVLAGAGITALVVSEEAICQPDVTWPVLR
ncbi:MAG: FtsW/RodA/SpoVE family cell cycle protein, partial [Paucibacter sp.]|nr:FtsW/RodA/SpoVE family cell cycle protein [Roseateles sp.]